MDFYAVQFAVLKPEEVRRAVIPDALVDMGANMLSLPGSLNFVVDPQGQRLIGNPAHGGEHIIEAF